LDGSSPDFLNSRPVAGNAARIFGQPHSEMRAAEFFLSYSFNSRLFRYDEGWSNPLNRKKPPSGGFLSTLN
jgi:hypothetical protein